MIIHKLIPMKSGDRSNQVFTFLMSLIHVLCFCTVSINDLFQF